MSGLKSSLRLLGFGLALLVASFSTFAAESPSKKAASESKPAKIDQTSKLGVDSLGLYPEVLGAKAFLEGLLARRYSQDLATVVNQENFSLGASLSLVETPEKLAERARVQEAKKAKEMEADPYSDTSVNDLGIPLDLTIGTLDAEALIKKYADPEVRESLQNFFSSYRIKYVNISIGLKGKFTPETMTTVETWLKNRLKSEFGDAGKGAVTLINEPVTEQKTWLEHLNQFQSLAGQLVVAFAILLGVLLWSLLSGKSASTEAAEARAPAATPAISTSAPTKESEQNAHEKVVSIEDHGFTKEIRQYSRRLSELAPRMSEGAEKIIRSWCQSGEEGYFKLACLAEAAGRETGKLPIPVDALEEVSRVFGQMHEYPAERKLETLKKIYWDLLSAINLGTETLDRPFGYLGSLSLGMVNQVLIEQNSKMKALVSLYMPTKLRESYLGTLSRDDKREILQQACDLREVSTDEFKAYDGGIRQKLRPEDRKDVIVVDAALKRLVAALTPLEEISLLSEVQGFGVDQFKKSTPSLAFLNEWPDDKLRLLAERCAPDEVLAYLRVRSDLKDRLLSLCPPMTAEVVSDELAREDVTSESEKNKLLSSMKERLAAMIDSREVTLEVIFKDAGKPVPMEAISNAA